MKVRISLRRLLGVALVMLLVLSLAVPGLAAGTKQQVRRAISIAFDNSGSMYLPSMNDMAWCRAQYAMEVFADMMNEGDVLQIYPMCTVTTNGQTYEGRLDSRSYINDPALIGPLEIHGGEDSGLIRNIYTVHAGGTPIETIDDAYYGLKEMDGDEKWLIVLTDGDTFASAELNRDYTESETPGILTERLSKYGQDVNVLYLGIGAGAAMPDSFSTPKKFYADKAVNSADVLSKLTFMCNMIFGRDSMEVSGEDVSFEISMNKLIVFVQGSDISSLRLVDTGGQEIGAPIATYTPRFSETGCGNYAFNVDTNLSGMIVVYGPCEKGDYTLEFSGTPSGSAQIYYEPDVDLTAQLIDETGKIVENPEDAYAGSYTLRYGLIDGRTGEMVTSDQLGKTHYDLVYEVDGQPFQASSDEKTGELPLQVEAGQTVDVTITATYLSGYTITKSTKDQSLSGIFSRPLEIQSRPVGELELRVSGGQDVYKLSALGEEAVYTAEVWYDGEKLTGSALKQVTPEVSVQGGELGWELDQTGDGFRLTLDHKGDPADTVCGAYTVTLGGSYLTEDNLTATAQEESLSFTIEDDRFGLSAEFDLEQRHYVSYRLGEGKPILLRIAKDGQPLTAEELAQVQVDLDMDGLQYSQRLLSGESAVELTLDGEQKADKGRHPLTAAVTMVDPLGQPLTANAETSIQIQPYPAWVPWLIALLILAVIALLLFLFLNAKVLPKSIYVYDTRYSVGGRAVTTDADSDYHKFNAKSGKFSVSSPRNPNYPAVSCSVDVDIAPRDKRIKVIRNKLTHGSSRSALITNITASDNITNASMDGNSFVLKHGEAVEPDFDGAVITNEGVCTIRGSANTSSGRKPILMTFKLVMK